MCSLVSLYMYFLHFLVAIYLIQTYNDAQSVITASVAFTFLVIAVNIGEPCNIHILAGRKKKCVEFDYTPRRDAQRISRSIN